MNAILSLLERLATWRGFVVLLVLYAIVFGMIIVTLSRLTALTGGIGILDFDRGYSTERVRQVFDSYGEQGFALYGRIQLLDLANPALYSLIFACLIYLLWKNRRAVWVAVLPIAAGVLDYSENLTLFLLARSYPDISPGLVGVSSTLSLVKNAALFASVAVLAIGLVFRLRETAARKPK